MSSFMKQQKFYSDGITRITDPFWKLTCNQCGKCFVSCICISKCPQCGAVDSSGVLGKKTYAEIIAERGEPKIPDFLKD